MKENIEVDGKLQEKVQENFRIVSMSFGKLVLSIVDYFSQK